VAAYRVFFWAEDGTIVGRDDFDADDDAFATAIAHMLADACSDRCAAFELWQSTRRVDTRFPIVPRAEDIAAAAQQTVLDRELAIRDSKWIIADSVRLLEQTKRLLNTRDREG
jgi:hypothetical protein